MGWRSDRVSTTRMAGEANTRRQPITFADALSFVSIVEDTFRNDDPQKYRDFLAVLQDFLARRISKAGLIATIMNLFEGHPDLILGFSIFLPQTR